MNSPKTEIAGLLSADERRPSDDELDELVEELRKGEFEEKGARS